LAACVARTGAQSATSGSKWAARCTAVGAEQAAAERSELLLERGSGEAHVADHDLAGLKHALEQLGGDDALGRVAGASSKPTGSPSG
jgi:hypothetical protein